MAGIMIAFRYGRIPHLSDHDDGTGTRIGEVAIPNRFLPN